MNGRRGEGRNEPVSVLRTARAERGAGAVLVHARAAVASLRRGRRQRVREASTEDEEGHCETHACGWVCFELSSRSSWSCESGTAPIESVEGGSS